MTWYLIFTGSLTFALGFIAGGIFMRSSEKVIDQICDLPLDDEDTIHNHHADHIRSK